MEPQVQRWSAKRKVALLLSLTKGEVSSRTVSRRPEEPQGRDRRDRARPNGAWMGQVARNLTDADVGFPRGARYLIHDRDPLFTAGFEATLKSSGDAGSIADREISQVLQCRWIPARLTRRGLDCSYKSHRGEGQMCMRGSNRPPEDSGQDISATWRFGELV